MSKKEYKRHEWKLSKVYCFDDDKWRYQPLYKTKVLLFFPCWCIITERHLKWCNYPHLSDKLYYEMYGDFDLVSFNSPEKAQEFIDCFENYRKKMVDIENELKYDRYVAAK